MPNPSVGTDPAEIIALLIMPPIVSAILYASAWVHYRQLNRDKPLTDFQRRLMKYWFFFVLGAGYVLLVPAMLREPRQIGILLTGGWALLMLTLYRRRSPKDAEATPRIPSQS